MFSFADFVYIKSISLVFLLLTCNKNFLTLIFPVPVLCEVLLLRLEKAEEA